MAPWRRTNPLALAALVTLFEQPRHAYDIARTLKQRHADESMRLNFGSLYGVVSALEREGFIEATEVERAGNRPERTVYRITDDGIEEARDWLTDLLSRPVKEYLGFEAALTLIGAMPPDDALAALDERSRALKALLAKSEAGRAAAAAQYGLPRLFLIEGEYAESLIRAEIEFVDELVTELRDGTFPDLDEWRTWSKRSTG